MTEGLENFMCNFFVLSHATTSLSCPLHLLFAHRCCASLQVQEMETAYDNNSFSQQQHEEFARTKRERGRESQQQHLVQDQQKQPQCRSKKPCHQSQCHWLIRWNNWTIVQSKAIGIMSKYFHSSNAKNKNMLISSLWLIHLHKCFQQHINETRLPKNYKSSPNQELHALEKCAKTNGTS